MRRLSAHVGTRPDRQNAAAHARRFGMANQPILLYFTLAGDPDSRSEIAFPDHRFSVSRAQSAPAVIRSVKSDQV